MSKTINETVSKVGLDELNTLVNELQKLELPLRYQFCINLAENIDDITIKRISEINKVINDKLKKLEKDNELIEVYPFTKVEVIVNETNTENKDQANNPKDSGYRIQCTPGHCPPT